MKKVAQFLMIVAVMAMFSCKSAPKQEEPTPQPTEQGQTDSLQTVKPDTTKQ
jgi:hypothetical protein